MLPLDMIKTLVPTTMLMVADGFICVHCKNGFKRGKHILII